MTEDLGDEAEAETKEVADASELIDEALEGESWSDDPVRMYLTQMGEIPLLTRRQEIELAKRIEGSRQRFRAKLLECNYVIQSAYKVLCRVHRGELPFDRTVQVWADCPTISRHSTSCSNAIDVIIWSRLTSGSPKPSGGPPGSAWAADGDELSDWSKSLDCGRSGSSR